MAKWIGPTTYKGEEGRAIKWPAVIAFILALFVLVSPLVGSYFPEIASILPWVNIILFIMVVIISLMSVRFIERLAGLIMILLILITLDLGDVGLMLTDSFIKYPWAAPVVIMFICLMIILWHKGAQGTIRQSAEAE